MFKTRTLKFLLVIVAAYVVVLLPGFAWPSYFDSPAGYLVLVPFLSLHVLHKAGVPGLLQRDGLCGWGWCSPTMFGWLFLALFWLGIAWCIARCADALVGRFATR